MATTYRFTVKLGNILEARMGTPTVYRTVTVARSSPAALAGVADLFQAALESNVPFGDRGAVASLRPAPSFLVMARYEGSVTERFKPPHAHARHAKAGRWTASPGYSFSFGCGTDPILPSTIDAK